MTETETEINLDELVITDEGISFDTEKQLIVINDDVNTFEHVILCLMTICGLSAEKAIECTLNIHNKGKCAVKSGSYNDLKPLKDALLDKHLSAEIK